MTQFDTTFGQESGAPVRTSGLAITALICSLIFCCPLTTVLGVLLGLIAIPVIASNPQRKGTGLALAAIIIGLLATAVQIWGANWGWKNWYEPVLKGPHNALTAGAAGDVAGFKASFYGDGAVADDAVALAFIEEVELRYGTFSSAFIDGQQNTQPQFGQPSASFLYELQFDSGTQRASAEMVFADQTTGAIIMKPASVTILDADRGDLTYPPSITSPGALPSPGPSDADGAGGGG